MTTRLPNASQQAAANAVVDQLDSAAGTLKIYTGSQPADSDPAGTLLATFTLPAPAFGAANTSGTAALLGVPLATTASAGGTAGCFAIETNAGGNVFQGSITATGGGGDITLDNTNIASGQSVQITGLNYTHPAG